MKPILEFLKGFTIADYIALVVIAILLGPWGWQ